MSAIFVSVQCSADPCNVFPNTVQIRASLVLAAFGSVQVKPATISLITERDKCHVLIIERDKFGVSLQQAQFPPRKKLAGPNQASLSLSQAIPCKFSYGMY